MSFRPSFRRLPLCERAVWHICCASFCSLIIAVFVALFVDVHAQTPSSVTPAAPPPPARKTNASPKLTGQVVVVVVDELPGVCLTQAARCGVPLLGLANLVRQGVLAQTLEGVFPTQAAPAYASLLTGRFPVDHGVYADTRLDAVASTFTPLVLDAPWPAASGQSILVKDAAQQGAQDGVLLPWRALQAAGVRVAAINFPFTPHAPAQGFHWLPLAGAARNANRATPADQLAFVLDQDQRIVAQARAVLAQSSHSLPQLVLLRLTGYAFAQRQFGAQSPQRNAALQTLSDALTGFYAFLQRQAAPAGTTLLLVAPHGTMKAERVFHPNVLLHKQGWLQMETAERAKADWRALVQPLGGSAAVFVRREQDEADVLRLFSHWHEQPDSAIWRIITRREAAALGANPQAAFYLDAAPGYRFGAKLSGAITTPADSKIVTGTLPQRAEMHGALLLLGKGIRPGAKLEFARLVDLAPTIAHLLGLEPPATRGRVLVEALETR